MMARTPMRPTAFKCPPPAMPATSVVKINGAMIILIMRRNSWLNGLTLAAHAGFVTLIHHPTSTPMMRPSRICLVSERCHHGLRAGGGVGVAILLSLCCRGLARQVLDDVAHDGLGVAEEHQCVRVVIELVLDTRKTRIHAAFDAQHRSRSVCIDDRHAVNRAGR